MIASPKRWFADKQLMNEHAQCPVVDSTIVSFVQDNFGSNIFRGSGKSPRLLIGVDAFGESEIDLYSKQNSIRFRQM